MELIVGTNSYMTLQEANDLINNTFSSTDNKLIYWKSLNDNDKKIFIVNTTKIFDRECLMYNGIKSDIEQKMQYPRIVHNNTVECPDDVKSAICIQMLREITINNNQFKQLIDLGVDTYRESDGASVSFNSDIINKKSSNKVSGIYKDLWNEYISEYSQLI